ncbi:hypothetical protein DPMN_183010 [Dreissena polymorpha]|uniref:Uncharacterized protein n=1 Tax=Dreissena polymorpha TaxID=45954 RepID=A0A9D4DJ81_DREPO|nr:hypothetical protein DPMN_183010 [Dreissena polymorpha]
MSRSRRVCWRIGGTCRACTWLMELLVHNLLSLEIAVVAMSIFNSDLSGTGAILLQVCTQVLEACHFF